MNVPVPHYPPFKLRSSLIDKDPVIWAHYLEAYLHLLQFIQQGNLAELSVKSQQQFVLFLKTYLHESSMEKGQIFSLGAINPDIKRNGELLRGAVFQCIKNYSFVRLSVIGESIWDFIQLYASKNIHTVRGLTDGSFKSVFNDNKKSGKISSVPSLQKHLQQLISRGNFTQDDLSCLSAFLGQQTARSTTYAMGSSNATVTKNSSSNLPLAESFVDAGWIEYLEQAYAGGKSVNADTIKDVMIVSLISLSSAKMANLLKDLRITSVSTLSIAPLLSSIIISEPYRELIPDLESRVHFLKGLDAHLEVPVELVESGVEPAQLVLSEQDIQNISMLKDLFPDLSDGKAKALLDQYNNDTELVTDLLLENPDLMQEVEVAQPQPDEPAPTKVNLTMGKPLPKRSIYDEDDISLGKFANAKITFGKKPREKLQAAGSDLKKKTLDAALRMLYESDEDEPDDTYDDQEKTSGEAVEDESRSKSRKSGRLAVLEDASALASASTPPPASAPASSGVDGKERHLFSIYKRDGEQVFAKTVRKSAGRQKLKKEIGWSDEQIEGWLRMLLKSPRRYKILEEDFLYGGGNPNRRSKSKAEQKDEYIDYDDDDNNNAAVVDDDGGAEKKNSKPSPPVSKEAARRTQARNEKNKASRANHNRKSQHDKKSRSTLVGMQSSNLT
ncbi:uncharacterized protein LODBEIA_P25580 [Lodderomyces beijingensis]|uniref:CUE domain-containing protein n=1 Tax=Lodderomyces beijingensis TaxID=1775926 RepID=A0ABP0ZJL7_9ASCO